MYNKKVSIISLLILLYTFSGSAAPLKVFLLGGQSNMVGTGNIMDLPAELRGPQSRVMIYNGGTGEYDWTTLEPGVGAYTGSFGPEVSFGYDMAAAYPGEDIAIIKVAWSGTSLAYDWRPPSSGDTLGRLYTAFVAHVWNALNTLPGSTDPQIMGMCWMQGESDASNIYPASEYEVNLINLISDLRGEFNVPRMPFIIALIDRTPVWQEYEVVRQAQQNVSDTDPYVDYFDTDPYPTDGSHYYPEGLILMGEDFAATLLPFLGGSTGNPPPPQTPGDVNGNGQTDIIDALMVAQYYVGLNPSGFNTANGDVNGDESITIIDALMIAQYYVGLIDL